LIRYKTNNSRYSGSAQLSYDLLLDLQSFLLPTDTRGRWYELCWERRTAGAFRRTTKTDLRQARPSPHLDKLRRKE